jgi:hypothetical protein
VADYEGVDMSNPNQPPPYGPPPYGPPPTVTINQKSGCMTAFIVLLVLFIIGTIFAILFMGGCLAVFA